MSNRTLLIGLGFIGFIAVTWTLFALAFRRKEAKKI